MSDTTFMTSSSLFLTSESVTEGHPDKLCDQISDAILDAFITQDRNARVACETAVTTGLVLVLGEISLSEGYVDIPGIVRNVIKDVGYTRAKYGFDYETCGVSVSIKEQSSDIAQGVDKSLEVREGEGDAAELEQGAGDQGMMIGFACNETPELMPLTISLAHKLCRRLAHVRREGVLDYLRPDGKSQVTVEYEYGQPKRIDAIVLSSQHDPVVSHDQMERDFRDIIIDEVISPELIDDQTRVFVNPTGRFVIGGPMGDAGLTGRKIIVDSYGGIARHGGGAFSGKDPTKVDRSAAYAARYVAKNVVAAGLADRAEFQLSYAIGVARPTSIAIETFGTGRVADETILHLVQENFDLRPAAIIRDLDLRRPIYRPTASYGHFGRDDIDAPWERTDRADALRRGAGLTGKEALLEVEAGALGRGGHGRSPQMYAITIVGGKGERLRPLTNDRPKCMVPLAGRPILEHHIEWLRAGGVTDVVVACGHLHEQIKEYFGSGERIGVRVVYSVEDQQLGRGGAFKLAHSHVPPDQAIMIGTNGDNFNTQPLAPVIEQHVRTNAVATLLLTQLRSPYGIVRTSGTRITGFDEKPLLPHWLSAGVYVLSREFFSALPDRGDHEDELFPRLAAEGRLHGFQSNAYWKAIDTVKDLREAEEGISASGTAAT